MIRKSRIALITKSFSCGLVLLLCSSLYPAISNSESSSHDSKKKDSSHKESSTKEHGSKSRKIRASKTDKSKGLASTSAAHDDKHPKALSGDRDLVGESGVPDDEVIQAVLVLDNSRSMLKTDPTRIRDQGAKLFLQFLEQSDYFSIVQFAEDSKVVVPFTKISQTKGEEISESLKSIVNDGNFTDFLSGIEIAQSLFEENPEIKAKNKAIILISDGQNDPNPAKHTKELVSSQILEKKIPLMKKKGIRIYTLAMSEFSDQKFLAEISKSSGGLSWYADSMNEVHRVFSDLFLALKKPQVIELTKDGFEIDSSSNEATFIINRKSENESIRVIDPTDQEFLNSDFPSTWKWFRAELFDIITVPNPLAGRWIVKSSDNTNDSQPVNGYAKLVTKLNLEYSWPQGVLDVGSTAILKVRLVGDPAIVEDQQIKDLIFYSYKIVNVKTGAVYSQGKLNDAGEQGDDKSLDNIYSTSISFNEDGEYKLFVSCIGPTFSRQSHIPVVISRGLISLEKVPENTFSHRPEHLLVKLHGEAKSLKNRKLNIVAQVLGEENSKPYGVKVSELVGAKESLEIELDSFKNGENKIYAIVSGLDSHGEEVKAKSEEIVVNVKAEKSGHGDEHGQQHEHGEEVSTSQDDLNLDHLDPQGEASEHEGESIEEESTWFYGIVGPVLNLIFGFLLARFFIKKSKQEKGVSIQLRPAYSVESSLQERLSKIVECSSKTRKRSLKPEEIEVFSALPELSQILSQIEEAESEVISKEEAAKDLSEQENNNSAPMEEENADPNKTEEMDMPDDQGVEKPEDSSSEDESLEQGAKE